VGKSPNSEEMLSEKANIEQYSFVIHTFIRAVFQLKKRYFSMSNIIILGPLSNDV
jgi:hypothetical protein